MIVSTLDNEISKLTRLNSAINDAIKFGYWIVIENANCLDSWPNELLKTIYVNKSNQLFELFNINSHIIFNRK